MNIQIFGKKKCFDTKKAERWFKERRIKFQQIDLVRFGMSGGEFDSVLRAMGGVDAVIFTAGVGENGPETRESACAGLEFLGIKIDPEKDKVRGKEMDVSADDAKVRVLVIPTNEELMIAMDTAAIVK